jgi:hypothetical protein
MGKQTPYGEDWNRFWADDALACASMLSRDGSTQVVDYEAIHMIRKGQVRWVAGDDLLRQIRFIDSLFELAA